MPDDLEPIDLEPVDLEPADLGNGGDEARFDPERDRERRPKWVWFGLIGAAIVAWAAIALTTGGNHSHPSATPAPTTTTPPPVDPLARLTPVLHAGLRGIGSGHFAAIINDRLYLVDETRPEFTLVPLPEGHVTIQDQNGTSLIASTSAQTVVDTAPFAARTLSVRDTAIRSASPAQWWILRSDGTVRSFDDGTITPVPDGLRVVAGVRQGFVALSSDSSQSGLVLWSGDGVKPIASAGGQYLTSGPQTIVLKDECGYSGCKLDIVDLARGTVVTNRLSRIPAYGSLSPDGTRLALATTQGDIILIDVRSGRLVAQLEGLGDNPSLPFTWTTGGQALLVTERHSVQMVLALTGQTIGAINQTDGLEQLFALP